MNNFRRINKLRRLDIVKKKRMFKISYKNGG